MKINDRRYKPFAEWRWRNYDEDTTVNVDDFLKSHKDDYFLIGTDSQNYGSDNQCVFTTVIIAYKLGKGGSIILHKDKTVFVDALRQRLLLEAMRSLEAAWYIDSKIDSKNILEIHLDINENPLYKSGKYKDELIGLISAQGYKCIIKPDAYACCAADKRTKNL